MATCSGWKLGKFASTGLSPERPFPMAVTVVHSHSAGEGCPGRAVLWTRMVSEAGRSWREMLVPQDQGDDGGGGILAVAAFPKGEDAADDVGILEVAAGSWPR